MTPSPPPSITLADETGRSPLEESAAVAALTAAIAHARDAGRLDDRPVELTAVVLDDAALRRLNATQLGHDYETDVVTFPFKTPDRLEGEIYVSLETAAREATARGATTAEELTLYLVHGTLHLAGWDDHTPSDRAAMRAAERTVLATLGITIDAFE